MYNKYRSFQKIITIIILFFPAQKIYIDTSITPQIKTLYTLHPFQTFQNSTHSHTKKQLKTHKKLPFFYTFPHFYINIIPYNTIQPPQIHPNKPTNNSINSTLYPYTLHPIPYPINPNNKAIIFSFLSLFSFFPAPPPEALLYSLYAALHPFYIIVQPYTPIQPLLYTLIPL